MVRRFAAILSIALVALLACPSYSAPNQSPSANVLFGRAKAEAQRTHRNILLVFSSSWCVDCKLFDLFLEDPQMKRINRKAFVIQHITIGEYARRLVHLNVPGGEELRATLGAVGNPGLPFLVITTADGVPIVTSYENGDTRRNIGGAVDEPGIDWYMEMLKRGAPSLTEADRAAIREWLRVHSPGFKSMPPVEPFHLP